MTERKTKQGKINWLDLGMSDPLILGMANHPLKDRLETLGTTPVNKRAARSMMVALFAGTIIVSAPLTIVDASAEDKLPDAIVSVDTDKTSKSVIKVTKKDKNGNNVRKHYEVEINGTDIQAYEVDVAGRRIKIDENEIDGFDSDVMANSKTWAFIVDDDMDLAFDAMAAERFAKKHKAHEMKHRIIRLEGERENMENVKRRLSEMGLSEAEAAEIEKRVEEGLRAKGLVGDGIDTNVRTFVWNSDTPKPPFPPEVMSLEGAEASHIILKRSGEGERFVHFDHDEFQSVNSGKIRLEAAQSMLESVEEMLSNMDDLKGEEKALRDAKRDLEKAQRSLQKAQEKIEKSKAAAGYK